MKKIGFMGAYDKSNFIIYTAKILATLNYKVLVVDTTSVQKMKYIIPSINPTKSYITDFESIDFAIGFETWEEIERYLGIKFYSNEEGEITQRAKEKKDGKVLYDYVLIDIDASEKIENFGMDLAYKNYFVTSFDMFSLKKGMSIFRNLAAPMNLTKILFSYEASREDEEYLNYVSLEYRINWNDYTIYFQILGENNKVFEENQRFEKIRFRKLTANFKESLAYVIQDISKDENIGKIRKAMKD